MSKASQLAEFLKDSLDGDLEHIELIARVTSRAAPRLKAAPEFKESTALLDEGTGFTFGPRRGSLSDLLKVSFDMSPAELAPPNRQVAIGSPTV